MREELKREFRKRREKVQFWWFLERKIREKIYEVCGDLGMML